MGYPRRTIKTTHLNRNKSAAPRDHYYFAGMESFAAVDFPLMRHINLNSIPVRICVWPHCVSVKESSIEPNNPTQTLSPQDTRSDLKDVYPSPADNPRALPFSQCRVAPEKPATCWDIWHGVQSCMNTDFTHHCILGLEEPWPPPIPWASRQEAVFHLDGHIQEHLNPATPSESILIGGRKGCRGVSSA